MSVHFLRKAAFVLLFAFASGGALANPSGSLQFFPNTITAGGTSVMQLELIADNGNPTTGDVASFTYVSGLVNDASPVVANTCGGTLTAVPGANSMSITGVTIAALSCDIQIRVRTASPTDTGVFTNVFPANGFVTSTFSSNLLNFTAILAITPRPLVVTTGADSLTGILPGSLRDVMDMSSTYCAGSPTLSFNIPGTGPQTISPLRELPALTCSGTVIDGTTQPGSAANTDAGGSNNAVIMVVLDGSSCPAPCNGIVANAAATVRGLAIRSFSGAGISGSAGLYVYGNYIGTDAGGMAPFGNGIGVHVSGGNLGLGSGSAQDHNVISSNTGAGVQVDSYGTIAGNQLGGGRDGSAVAGMGNGTGISLATTSSTSTSGNFVRYNSGNGITIDPSSLGKVLFSGNASFGNGGIGIDFGNDGPMVNVDTFPYDARNTPVITSVDQSGGNTTIQGTLKSTASRIAQVELYHNSVLRTQTEGELRIATLSVSTDATGIGVFSTTVPGSWNNISATAMIDTCNDACYVSTEYSASKAVTVQSLTLAPTSVDFGTAIVNTPSASRTVVLTNSGNVAITLTGVPAVTGDFTSTTNCGTTLLPAETCTVTIVFSPTASGARAGTLTVTSSVPASPQTVALTGTGTAEPVLALSIGPTSVVAGGLVSVGIVVSNIPGIGALADIDGSLTYPTGFLNDTPINLAGTCGANFSGVAGGSTLGEGSGSVSAGATCTLVSANVRAPAAVGTYTFTIPAGGMQVSQPTSWKNSTPITATVDVVAPATPMLSISPASLTFAAQVVNTTSGSQTVTLTNSGTTSVSFTSIASSGDFAAAPSCPTTLAAGAACSVLVTFTPTAVGALTGALTVTSNASGSPHTVSLSGSGVAAPAPAVQMSPASLLFASQSLGTSSAPQSVSVTNTGTATLVFTSPPVASGDFSLTTTCGTSLAAGASCAIAVTFTPTAIGSRTGSVGFATNAAGSPHSVALSGTGAAALAPAVQVSPASLVFASQAVGTQSAAQTVTILNNGTATLTFTSAPAASGDFSLTSTCASSLSAGASCAVDVRFTPTVAGARSGSVSFASNASGSPHSVSLSGTAVDTRVLNFSATALQFAPRAVGTTSPSQRITLASAGSAAVTIASFVATGDYSFSSACPTSLVPGATCFVDVTFTPLAEGPRNGSLAVSSNASGSPQSVTLSGAGSGVPLPAIELSPAQVLFGAQLVGTQGPVQAVIVHNSGSAPLFFSGMSVEGDFVLVPPTPSISDAGSKATVDACGLGLAVDASCQVQVAFAPASEGAREGFLRVSSNATAQPAAVRLAGTGIAQAVTHILDVQDSIDFGSVAVGTQSEGVPLRIGNNSAQVAILTGLASSGDFSVSQACDTIPAHGACSVLVFFRPTALGARHGSVTFTTPSEAQPYEVILTGVGEFNPTPQLGLSVTHIGFGDVLLGTSAAASVTLANEGQVPVALSGIATASPDFFVASDCGASVAVGARCTATVTFYPHLRGPKSGVLEVRSNALNNPHHVDLGGTGCAVPSIRRSRSAEPLCAP